MTKNISLNTNMSQISFSMILLGLLAVAFTLMADYLIFSSETENDAFATTSRRSSISIEQAKVSLDKNKAEIFFQAEEADTP